MHCREYVSSEIKKASVISVFKKGNHNDKTNYRLVSTFHFLSKFYEHVIYHL